MVNTSFCVTKADIINKYIEKHGFGLCSTPLSTSLTPENFRLNYYCKADLINFCRSHGLSSTGLKSELNARIELFLETGKVITGSVKKNKAQPDSEAGLSLTKQVINYKSDAITRAFFEKHIPGFKGFSAFIQKWLKQRLHDGDIFTYKDVVEKHIEFLQNKKKAKTNGEAPTVTHASCQFNQFFMDYSHDKSDKFHSAKNAWQLVRNSAGEKTYRRYKNRINEIISILDL